jgi:hypothetical protein
MTPWLVIILLLGNFMLMAFDAREITSGQRIIRVWSQSVADFVQSPVTSVSSGVGATSALYQISARHRATTTFSNKGFRSLSSRFVERTISR